MTNDIILTVESGHATLATVLERRKAGERACVVVGIEHPVAMRARTIWRDLETFSGDRDAQLEEIRAQRARPTEIIDDATRELYLTIFALADEVVSTSWVHVRGVERMLGVPIRNVTVRVPDAGPAQPRIARGEAYVAVIVNEDDPQSRAYAAFALGDLHAPVRFFTVDDLHACADAAIIIDADWTSPAAAVAAAAFGRPLVVSLTSGAREYVRAAGAYDPLVPESLADAARRALGAAGSAVYAADRPPIAVTLQEAPPHVTFLIRTKDRPDLLRRALGSVALQRDARVDAIVVNDGGERVDALVAAFPFAELVHRDQSDYVTAASVALSHATGTYVGLLDDDDALFPDHAAVLGLALERSGANLACVDSLNVYLDRTTPPHVTGYRVVTTEAVDRDVLLVSNPIAGSVRVLYRRSALVAAGGFRPLLLALDYDAYARMSRSNDFVRVPAITTMYSVFLDGRNRSVALGSEMRDAFERVYAVAPATGRPLIERRRHAMLESLRESGGYPLESAAVVLDVPLPL
jgi:hypothetical protein